MADGCRVALFVCCEGRHARALARAYLLGWVGRSASGRLGISGVSMSRSSMSASRESARSAWGGESGARSMTPSYLTISRGLTEGRGLHQRIEAFFSSFLELRICGHRQATVGGPLDHCNCRLYIALAIGCHGRRERAARNGLEFRPAHVQTFRRSPPRMTKTGSLLERALLVVIGD